MVKYYHKLDADRFTDLEGNYVINNEDRILNNLLRRTGSTVISIFIDEEPYEGESDFSIDSFDSEIINIVIDPNLNDIDLIKLNLYKSITLTKQLDKKVYIYCKSIRDNVERRLSERNDRDEK